jgi:hypothetical protein
VPGSTVARVCLPAPACGPAATVTLDGAAVQGAADGHDYVCVEAVGAGAHVAACGA